MSCKLNLRGIQDICDYNNAGGIKTVWIGDFNNPGFTITPHSGFPSVYINQYDINTYMKRYETVPLSSNYSTSSTINNENNKTYYTNNISLNFNHIDLNTYRELEYLADKKLILIIELYNGIKLLFGYSNFVREQSIQISGGTDLKDGVNVVITLKNTEKSLPKQVITQ